MNNQDQSSNLPVLPNVKAQRREPEGHDEQSGTSPSVRCSAWFGSVDLGSGISGFCGSPEPMLLGPNSLGTREQVERIIPFDKIKDGIFDYTRARGGHPIEETR